MPIPMFPPSVSSQNGGTSQPNFFSSISLDSITDFTNSLARLGSTASDAYNAWRPVWSGQSPLLAPRDQPLYQGVPTQATTAAPMAIPATEKGFFEKLFGSENPYVPMLIIGGVLVVAVVVLRK